MILSYDLSKRNILYRLMNKIAYIIYLKTTLNWKILNHRKGILIKKKYNIWVEKK